MESTNQEPERRVLLTAAECRARLAIAGMLGVVVGVLVGLAWLRAN